METSIDLNNKKRFEDFAEVEFGSPISGWGLYRPSDDSYCAEYYNTRKEARESKWKEPGDRVRKVYIFPVKE